MPIKAQTMLAYKVQNLDPTSILLIYERKKGRPPPQHVRLCSVYAATKSNLIHV